MRFIAVSFGRGDDRSAIRVRDTAAISRVATECTFACGNGNHHTGRPTGDPHDGAVSCVRAGAADRTAGLGRADPADPLTRVDGRPAAGCTPVRVPGTGPGAAMLHPAAGNSGGREMPVAEGPAHDFGFPVAAATRRSRAYAGGAGPPGGARSRYVVESPGNPHAYPPLSRRFGPAAILFRAAQEQMIGAALAGLSCSQASRMSGGLGTGQRGAYSPSRDPHYRSVAAAALARRAAGQSHPCPSSPRDRRMKGSLTWHGHIQARARAGRA
jgi:hypothetical protein